MNSPAGGRITAIHRQVGDVCWVADVHEHVKQTYGQAVVLNPVASYVVELVKNRELGRVSLPVSRSAAYVKEQMLAAMPPSFAEELTVEVTGAGYFKNKFRLWNRLFIKLGISDELLAENDAAFETLSPYGLLPDNNHRARFSATIGSVALERLDAEQKQQLQFGITDRLPKKLLLLPGDITIESTT